MAVPVIVALQELGVVARGISSGFRLSEMGQAFIASEGVLGFRVLGIPNKVLLPIEENEIGAGKKAIGKSLQQIIKKQSVSLNKLVPVVGKGLSNAGGSIKADIQIDTSKFEAAMRNYVQYSKKDGMQIVNQKAFSIALNAHKFTYTGDKATIKNQLNIPSDKYPNKTVAEMIVINSINKSKTRGVNVSAAAKKMVNRRANHVKSLKRTWLPAIKDLSPYVQKKGPGGTPVGDGFANPCKQPTLLAAAVIASVLSKVNDNKVDAYLMQGFQRAFDNEAASMQAYVQKKVDKQNQMFNSGQFG